MKKIIISMLIVLISIIAFIYCYSNRFDERYILYKLPYITIIKQGSKEYYINKEIISKYPEFSNIIFEEKNVEGKNYIDLYNVKRAIEYVKGISTDVKVDSINNLIIIAETNIYMRISILFLTSSIGWLLCCIMI